MKIRLYGKTLNTWYSENLNGEIILIQEEVEYKEYERTESNTWELVADGSEDFP